MKTLRALLVGGLCLVLPTVVGAQIVVPNTLVAGTTITASALNTNFSTIANHALDRVSGGTMTGTLTTVAIVPSASNTYDLGSTSAFYRTLHAKTSLILGQTTANYTLTWANPAAARAISFEDPLGTDVIAYKAATQTLSNKTLSAPTISNSFITNATLAGVFTGGSFSSLTITAPILSGTITGTYTLGGTPSIAASALTGSIADARLSANVPLLNAANTYTATEQTLTLAANAATSWRILNTNAGASASTNLLMDNDARAANLTLRSYSNAAGSTVPDISDSVLLRSTGAGGLTLDAQHASGIIRFVLGTTLRAGYDASGNYSFGSGGNITDAIATPTISACGGAPAAVIAGGKPYAMRVTVGNSVPNTCAVNFAMTFSNAPSCTANSNVNTDAMQVTSSTTQVTVTSAAGFSNGNVINIQCRGY